MWSSIITCHWMSVNVVIFSLFTMDPFTSVWTATGTLQPPSWKQKKGMKSSIKTIKLLDYIECPQDKVKLIWTTRNESWVRVCVCVCVCKETHQLLEKSSLWDAPQHCVWMVQDRHHFQNVFILCSDFHCQCSLMIRHISVLQTDIYLGYTSAG